MRLHFVRPVGDDTLENLFHKGSLTMKKPDAGAFLARLGTGQAEPAAKPRRSPRVAPPAPANGPRKAKPANANAPPPKPSRDQLKHFGGYVGDDTLEKIALLRVRLKKDNSELIAYAIEELHRAHTAKRAFGDA